MGPNFFAYLMLGAWPVLTILCYRRFGLEKTIIFSILGGYLFLPMRANFNLPLIPALNKETIPGLCILWLLWRHNHPIGLKQRDPLLKAALAVVFLAPLFTTLSNTDPLIYGPRVVTPLGISDYLDATVENLLIIFLPLMFGYRYLASASSHKTLVRAILICGLVYSVPILWEVRMSPQLHVWIYGFFPHEFAQHIRYGGFRPVVFVGHGLLVAEFMALVFLAAMVVARHEKSIDATKRIALLVYCTVILLMCKTMGAVLIAFALFLVSQTMGYRATLRVGTVLMGIVLLFPMMRNLDSFPDKDLVAFFEVRDPERAKSLDYRFKNEDILLDKANERALFGWGKWGRALDYNTKTGEASTVVDGYWIVQFGFWGWAGYLGLMLLFALPVMLQARLFKPKSAARKRHAAVILDPYTVVISLMLMLNLVDSIVNDSVSIVTALLAGALWGNYQWVRSPDRQAVPSISGEVQIARNITGAYAFHPKDLAVSPAIQAGLIASRRASLKTDFQPPQLTNDTSWNQLWRFGASPTEPVLPLPSVW